ncbi:MAG: thioredoxin-disulfide reductase [Oscillospiraceae bacterium]|nr:thioredoxin-disulfide reductase [Oscillospiraceae bacterium]
MSKIYDVIVLGAGPSGLTAGLYAGRSRLSTLIIEKGQDGGQIAITNEIENYPGQQLEGESGPSLIARMTEQAKKFGAERVSDVIKSVELTGDVKKLVGNKGEYLAKTVIIATGAFPRPIGCKNEAQYVGKGISFCATCDAAFFEDFEVYVVGGGDAAVEEAMYLTKFARKVTIIHRRDELRAAKSIQEKAFANPKLHFMWDTVVDEVGGDEILSKMVVKNTKTGELTTIEADEDDGMFGLFGFIGLLPNSHLFEGVIDMENGYIKTDDNMHTNIPGVFAAGDVRVKSLRQVVTAAADGAIAAMQAEHYIANLK